MPTPPDVDPLAAHPDPVPAPARVVPMPDVQSASMPQPGVRTDTRTAITRDGHLYVAGGGYLWRSTDGGRAWAYETLPPHLSVAGGFGIAADDTFVLLARSGDSDHGVVRSTDRGRTWSEPVELDMGPFNGGGGGWPHVYQHPDGPIMVTLTLRHTGVFEDLADGRSGLNEYLYRSHDGGRTWGPPELLYRFGAEASLCALCDSGRMLAIVRGQRLRLPGDADDFVKALGGPPAQAWVFKNGVLVASDDGGRTWSGARLFSGYGDVPGELVRCPDGRLAALWLRRYPYPEGHIRVRLSDDGGRTWEDTVYVLFEGAGYPSSVVRDDGTIVTVCESTRLDAGGQPAGPRTMVAAHWRPPAAGKGS